MKLGAVVVIMVLLGAGCSSPASPPLVAPPASDVVFFASERGITAADNRGAVLSADATVASADFSTLYAVRGDRLVTVDATGNRELASTAVPGGLTARAVSTSGRLVALTRGVGADLPAGREKTTIVVADPSGARAPWPLDLPGNSAPRAATQRQREPLGKCGGDVTGRVVHVVRHENPSVAHRPSFVDCGRRSKP